MTHLERFTAEANLGQSAMPETYGELMECFNHWLCIGEHGTLRVQLGRCIDAYGDTPLPQVEFEDQVYAPPETIRPNGKKKRSG